MSPPERLLSREERHGPIMTDLHKWLTEQIQEKKPSFLSGLGQATNYILN